MGKIFLCAFSVFAIISCEFSKSVNINLISGLSTAGDGLSCSNVYLSIGENEIKRTTFTYGEIFYLNFNNIEGFKREEENVFPGMKLLIISTS